MKILIVDTYYQHFLDHMYLGKKDLKNQSYDYQFNNLINASFGTSDAYSTNLKKYGWNAKDLIVNCSELQKKWAIENGSNYSRIAINIPPRFFRVPYFGSFISQLPGLSKIAIDQINAFEPDVLFCQDVNFFSAEVLKKIKKRIPLIVGQIASPLPPKKFLENYDLILTSFPHFVERLQQYGVMSEYFKIGFDERILDKIKPQKRDIDFSFVGGISRHHMQAIELIEYLSEMACMKIYGYGAHKLALGSEIRKNHNGNIWGIDMYRILARSRITLNRHIGVAENNANNMRLYEATGMGTLLLTDSKKNLGKIFEIGKEVITYSSKEDAYDKVKYYLNNPKEAKEIAKAGQLRTLTEHNYSNRMKKLNAILHKYLN